ncbi:MAG: 30S ribosomal protein S17 [Candidatus Omnitrophota bacterium]
MGKKKEFVGQVISDKMLKTVIVRVTHLAKHPKYSRIMKRYNKFKVHDEKGVAKIGDTVRIQETRPISKDKRFRLIAVVKKAATHIELKEDLK